MPAGAEERSRQAWKEPPQSAVRTSFVYRLWRCLIFGKSALAPSAPQRQHLLTIIALQSRRRFGQEAEDYCAIVVDKFDETGLYDEATELDEVSRAFAPLHLPVAAVMTCHGQAETVAR